MLATFPQLLHQTDPLGRSNLTSAPHHSALFCCCGRMTTKRWPAAYLDTTRSKSICTAVAEETVFCKFLHPGQIQSDPGADQSGSAGGGGGRRTAEQRKVHCLACGWCCSLIFPVNTSTPQSAAVVCRFQPSRRRRLYRRFSGVQKDLAALFPHHRKTSLDEWTLASSRPVFPTLRGPVASHSSQ